MITLACICGYFAAGVATTVLFRLVVGDFEEDPPSMLIVTFWPLVLAIGALMCSGVAINQGLEALMRTIAIRLKR